MRCDWRIEVWKKKEEEEKKKKNEYAPFYTTFLKRPNTKIFPIKVR